MVAESLRCVSGSSMESEMLSFRAWGSILMVETGEIASLCFFTLLALIRDRVSFDECFFLDASFDGVLSWTAARSVFLAWLDFSGVEGAGSFSSAAARANALDRLHWMISGKGQIGNEIFPQKRTIIGINDRIAKQRCGKKVKMNFTEFSLKKNKVWTSSNYLFWEEILRLCLGAFELSMPALSKMRSKLFRFQISMAFLIKKFVRNQPGLYCLFDAS